MTEQNREGECGELGVVYDRKNAFLAIGLYDPDSPLRLRVLHAGKPVGIDSEWWRQHWLEPIKRRTGLFDQETTGYRCINGESDGWPGLVLDRYGETCVLKVYTAAWFDRLPHVVDLFKESFPGKRLVLRLSRNISGRDTASRKYADGQVLWGEPVTAPVIFKETGLLFEAEVLKGQKTGFFLDQRDNRRRIERLAAGLRVLNVFSFSGGFSLYAARGGAVSVESVDMSVHALESAQRNFTLNAEDARVRACRHVCTRADAFTWLTKGEGSRYDLVILDPPSLAVRDAAREAALKGYAELVTHGIRLLAARGILVAASCSAHVSAQEFSGLVLRECQRSGRKFEKFDETGHASDHPAGFPEADYLKAVWIRFEP